MRSNLILNGCLMLLRNFRILSFIPWLFSSHDKVLFWMYLAISHIFCFLFHVRNILECTLCTRYRDIALTISFEGALKISRKRKFIIVWLNFRHTMALILPVSFPVIVNRSLYLLTILPQPEEWLAFQWYQWEEWHTSYKKTHVYKLTVGIWGLKLAYVNIEIKSTFIKI